MSDEALVVEVETLEAVLNLLLHAVKDRFGPSISLASDTYWQLDPDDAFGDSDAPVAKWVGSTAEDIQELRDLLTRDPLEVFLWHDLDHLAGLLTRIAYLDRSEGSPSKRRSVGTACGS
jgi:hypothetical protein